jgi:quercetin dioxygenase-like cupin family protein
MVAPLKSDNSVAEVVVLVVKVDQVPIEPVSSPLFTGPEVTRQALLPGSRDFIMNIIAFGKGVRNKLHTHESDQVLIVTSGMGIVATEKEQHFVSMGDLIFVPAGEKHWHGATSYSDFAHISLTRVGSKTTGVEQ